MSIATLQTHYGFTKMPFGRDVPPQALHAHPSHREAIARINWCVSQRQLGVITGEVGAGKTVAVRAALHQLEPSRHQVIYIADPTITMRGIHTAIVTALGGQPVFYSGVLASQTASLLAGELDERSRPPVVVIDEAHLLSNTDLEALRMLTNTEMDTGSHFALLLIGQPTLRRRLKLAVLAALDQRISTRYTITGMGPADTTDYIRQHLKYAGRSDPLFSDDATTAIHQASRGYPRAVNNLAVASLIATYASNKSIVDLGAAQSAITENSE
ncbi:MULTISPECIES: ExeA family protein [unclassified Arthrobacter]|uniref:ExeA family protein n=1 Tax=unclassified Arthrobacter TaxID=235627 RepID=UPI002DFB3423|nr:MULTISPECIES: AAA family ATPase [unclassified Arthrobacter]MEC5193005.1 type II secretory pathway predicted ATPase ExeA [Arthrobacter sp. MP_M4]MEC5204534.1 type II secretory pathway predicted ATPase ExeA [Arthrobacter sp. MP_M7]